jgi:hypothetical protein
LGLAGLAYDASQDFAGAKSLFGAIDKAARGEATFSEAFNAAFPVGSIVGGFQSAATRGGSRALVNAGDEVLNQAAFTGAEVVNGFRVFGNKGLVGRTFNRNILLLEAEQIGARSPRGLLRAFEAEARAAGADELSIVGHGVINPKFLNPKLAERLGYQFEQINPDTVRIFKLLDQQ